MNLSLDHLAAVAADEFLLDDPDLLLAEEADTSMVDICWENAWTPFAAQVWPLDAVS
jgi:hypothetical protein